MSGHSRHTACLCPRRSLPGRPERVIEIVVCHLPSEVDACLARSAVMDAPPQPCVDDLLSQLGGGIEMLRSIQICHGPISAVDVDVDCSGLQVLGQDFCDR